MFLIPGTVRQFLARGGDLFAAAGLFDIQANSIAQHQASVVADLTILTYYFTNGVTLNRKIVFADTLR